MKKALFISALLSILALVPLDGQEIERDVEEKLCAFFRQYICSATDIGTCRLDSFHIDFSRKSIDIYVNDRFAYQPFRPETTEDIYRRIESLLPRKVKHFGLTLWTDGRPIEALVPNFYRKRKKDNARLFDKLDYKGNAWVERMSLPYEADKGLQGRHIAVWQSHGKYYANRNDRWEWQRPRLFCTTEDLFTQSFVIPYLIPMLENAGACVYTPRERDTQRVEVVVDNDGSLSAQRSLYVEKESKKAHWQPTGRQGFAQRKLIYRDGENPFDDGTARFAPTGKKKNRAFVEWVPDIPETGQYAVYVSYQTLPNSISDAKYLVFHKGGVTEFRVNQQMGGGTWVYLGTFEFDRGLNEHGMVVLTNESKERGVVCADAVRFGGGMGNIARNGKTSGLPRYLEGARYAAQWGGMPFEVYGRPGSDNDYADDINVRSRALNYLAGGSLFNPVETGLGVPIEMSVAVHSDAGTDPDDGIIGTLGIYTTGFNGGQLATGTDRYASRDLSDLLLTQLQNDLRSIFNVDWTRRSMWNRNYSETRLPVVPSTIVEMLSHQNFADMRLGHDPNFKFAVGRALYKGILKFLCQQHGRQYVVQPLPVSHFAVKFGRGKNRVELTWRPVEDPLEETATPKEYIVYTRIGQGGFDNGVRVGSPAYTAKIEPGIVYSFKVTAVNRGGESFPSETLSAYCDPDGQKQVLIVNGFDRISGPAAVDTPDEAGFDIRQDPGVPYLYDISLCGAQTDFDRRHEGGTLGQSGDEWEGLRQAGNSFDYPFVHGKAIQAAGGYSFVSCSDEAVEDGVVSLEMYDVVDYLLGLEKTGTGYPARYTYYKTFPSPMQRALASYCRSGGKLLVSGAYVGSDMQGEGDQTFINQLLKYDSNGTVRVDSAWLHVNGPGGGYDILRLPNETVYALPSADCLRPLQPAFTAMTYAGSGQSAAVAYRGTDYRTYVMGFPFESIRDAAKRATLMASVLHFLTAE